MLSWSNQNGLSFQGDAVWRTSGDPIPMSLYVAIGLTEMKLEATVSISEKKIFDIATSALGLSGNFLDFALSSEISEYKLIVTKDPVAACGPAIRGLPSFPWCARFSVCCSASLSFLLCMLP